MNISSVQPDDIVKCDVKGRVFYAVVTEAATPIGDLAVSPITRETWRHVTARQVTEHYRKAGRPRPNRKAEA